MLQAFCSLVSRRAVLSPQPTSLEPKSVSNLTTDTGEISNKRSSPKEQKMLMTDGMPARRNGDPGEQHQGPQWLLAASDWTAKRPGCALGDEKVGALPCLAGDAGKGKTPVLPPGAVGNHSWCRMGESRIVTYISRRRVSLGFPPGVEYIQKTHLEES